MSASAPSHQQNKQWQSLLEDDEEDQLKRHPPNPRPKQIKQNMKTNARCQQPISLDQSHLIPYEKAKGRAAPAQYIAATPTPQQPPHVVKPNFVNSRNNCSIKDIRCNAAQRQLEELDSFRGSSHIHTKQNHPINRRIRNPPRNAPHQRSGSMKPPCISLLRTGTCKYANDCRYSHEYPYLLAQSPQEALFHCNGTKEKYAIFLDVCRAMGEIKPTYQSGGALQRNSGGDASRLGVATSHRFGSPSVGGGRRSDFRDMYANDDSFFTHIPSTSTRLPLNNRQNHHSVNVDIDNMSYEEILELEERNGKVVCGTDREVYDSFALVKYSLPTKHLSSSPDVEEKVCVICGEPFEEGNYVRMTPCSHDFHDDCLWKWLKSNKMCPLRCGDVTEM